MVDGAVTCQYHLINQAGVQAEEGAVPVESPLLVFVNGRELTTLMCTPVEVKALALGFLLNEGIIDRREDVQAVTVCRQGGCVDVWLGYSLPALPQRRIVTTGCAGGMTFEDLQAEYPPLASTLTVAPAQLWDWMTRLYGAATLHRLAGGVHTAALAKRDGLWLLVEDVGQHNTLDKLHGMAFLDNIDPCDGVLLSTGRISSEMLNKARRMQIPVVVSRTAPTDLSVLMARAWNIALVGYLRHDRMTVYAHPWRLGIEPGAPAIFQGNGISEPGKEQLR
ncbi:MAG: formate dehydrogenase accessory sulfurtransferase FdhD [Anaerolineae bacterium]|nr:formate dehydrogenase accessory sulfurtransferase FdhD [Anaerolineae bacterium]